MSGTELIIIGSMFIFMIILIVGGYYYYINVYLPAHLTTTPSNVTTSAPSNVPTSAPSNVPTSAPSNVPTSAPSDTTTSAPNDTTTSAPSNIPTSAPSNIPTLQPSNVTTLQPSNVTTLQPSNVTTLQPSNVTTLPPSNTTTLQPSNVNTCSSTNNSNVKCVDKLVSANGFSFANISANGNFTTYGIFGVPSWSSNNSTSGVGPYHLVMQTDGNLVLYDSTDTSGIGNSIGTGAIWTSKGDKGYYTGKGPYTLTINDDSSAVIKDSTGTIKWQATPQYYCVDNKGYAISGSGRRSILMTEANTQDDATAKCNAWISNCGNKNTPSGSQCTASVTANPPPYYCWNSANTAYTGQYHIDQPWLNYAISGNYNSDSDKQQYAVVNGKTQQDAANYYCNSYTTGKFPNAKIGIPF
jgi:hypothetical protein